MMRAVLTLVAALATAVPAAAQTDKPQHIISVNGQGEVTVAPDLAVLSAGVTTIAKTSREASQGNARIMTEVVQALKTFGIAEKDIQTSRLSLTTMYDSTPRPAVDRRITGFQATNRLTIDVRDLTKVSDVVDGVVAAGANDITGIRFTVSGQSKLLDQAREAAVADARRKAEIYARATGVKLGMPVTITEQSVQVPSLQMLARAAPGTTTLATPIAVGDETLRVTVFIGYELLR